MPGIIKQTRIILNCMRLMKIKRSLLLLLYGELLLRAVPGDHRTGSRLSLCSPSRYWPNAHPRSAWR